MANHAADVTADPIERIIATGGAATNCALLQVMANVFGVDVYRLDVENSAALGAALRAYHADRLAAGEPVSWETVVERIHRAEPRPPRLTESQAGGDVRSNCGASTRSSKRLHKDRYPIG